MLGKCRIGVMSLLLAAILAFSSVNVFADGLDTPVHEDPIDEIQYESDTALKSFVLPYGNKTFYAGVQVNYTIAWTEGVSSYITDIIYYPSDVYLNGTPYEVYALYPRHNANGTAYADYQIGNTSYIVRFVFQVSTYGETSLTAFVHE